jgi:thioesterase domain-containing protein
LLSDITWQVAESLGYERARKSGEETARGELIQDGWSAPRVVEIQSGGSKPPFFCVHQSSGYRALASELGPDQPLYVLPYEYLFEKQTERPLRDLAAELVQQIRAIQSKGPYFLGGMCLAGHVALAIAQELRAQGEEVGLLALFDCRAPDYVGFRSGSGRAQYVRERVKLHLRNLLGRGREGALPYVRDRLRNLKWLAAAWTWTASYKFWQRLGRPLPNQLRDSFHLMRRAVLSSPPTQVYPGRVALFLSTTQRAKELNLDSGFGWSHVAGGGLEIYEAPGNHRDLLLPPNVAILARQLQTCLRKAQAVEPSLYKVVVNLEEQ